ncbi:MAG: hypothetical protein V7609_1654 [Verrucomicrobiota bacterium]
MRISPVGFLAFIGLCSLQSMAAAADFLVITSSDSGPGSFRQAILDANASPGPDRVVFNIPGAGVQVISVLSSLPQITDSLVIDGYTQPGAKPNSLEVGSDAVLLINLQRAQSTNIAEGLTINASNCTIRGLSITNFLQQNPFFISGGVGIGVRGGSGNKIEGCFLGIAPDGTTAARNGRGIDAASPGTTIGGTSSAQRNIVSGNGLEGLLVISDGTTIAGNYIGTDAAGAHAIGNSTGVLFNGTYTTSILGGATKGAGNVISGNLLGVGLGHTTNGLFSGISNGVVVQGNLIGLAANGVDSLGNGQGIDVYGSQNLIGGTGPGSGNMIAFNPNAGVLIINGTGNSVLSNAIYSTNRINLDLGGLGRQKPNDVGDGDSGPNNYQNFPAIASVDIANNSATIKGNLNSIPNSQFTIQLFAESQSLTESKQTYLGSTSVTTDANGDAAFTANFPVPNANVRINATATSASGDTSQFFLNAPRFKNISTRGRIETGDNIVIGGFILSEGASIAVRALGPSLAGQLVPDPLLDPVLEVYRGNELVVQNDNWSDDATSARSLQSYGLAPNHPKEAAVARTLTGGTYTVVVRGKNNTTGAALVEVYELSEASISGTAVNLPNISTRGLVQTGDNALIGGITLGSGEMTTRVVARGIGPSLANARIANPLPDPTIELRDSDGILLAANDDWKDTQQTVLESTGLAPNNPAESAVLVRLGPGQYTAIVRGKSGSTGVGLVELYRLP